MMQDRVGNPILTRLKVSTASVLSIINYYPREQKVYKGRVKKNFSLFTP
jgi:hypothetical protein